MTNPAPQTGPKHGFGLYVHWPYCAAICPYCDFNVYAVRDPDTAALVNAICADVEGHHVRLPDHPPFSSVYLGGGTPSLLPARHIEQIITCARETFGIEDDAEITLEANPNDVLRTDLTGLRTAGVNRLSIGVQSLEDDALKFLGRDHDADDATRAVEIALDTFPNISIDLIYARPGQSPGAWEKELTTALALGAPHLSLYELTIATRTAFGKAVARGRMTQMPDDDQASLYELTRTITEAAGLPTYEISNHARSPEHQSQHNLTYWRSGDWVGVGPGAHGRLTIDGKRIATEATKRPVGYSKTIAGTDIGRSEEEALSPLETAQELLAMGLRPVEGVEMSRIEILTGQPLSPEILADFVGDGFLQIRAGRLALTPNGRLLADAIVAELAP